MLRSQRSKPMRRIGEPASLCLNSPSSQAKSSTSVALVEAVPRREIAFARQRRRAVPRTGQLAVVAAVDAVAQLAVAGVRGCRP
jgi:3-oxoacyl-(acyl-carrier-protein) synthase